jgi:phosphodiesterase/alkaline phosphatase D-like protein
MRTLLLLLLALGSCAAPGGGGADGSPRITHGPMLGRLGAREVTVWGRTSRPAAIRVRYGLAPDRLDRASEAAPTGPDRDLTATVRLAGLEPDTRYHYRLEPGGPGGTFRTLPDPEALRDPRHNPKGLFNFAFEFACGNNQGVHSLGPSLPAFRTMLARGVPERVRFAILNGDWLYEDRRDHPVEAWLRETGEPAPRVVALAPSIVGVWENYKTYLSRGEALAEWHRSVPSFFTADDHEILNDVVGCGAAGTRDRRAVFRDIALQAWADYLAWSNPVHHAQGIRFGRARLRAGSDVLEDPEGGFERLRPAEATNLHVHWGTPDAGVDDARLDGAGGDPNAGVYEIAGVLDGRRLRIRPAARADGEASYSIGRRSWFRLRVSNCEFLFLDTRSERAPKVSMIGPAQKAWLRETMSASDADFFFVVSSVNLTIPHVGAGGMNVAAADKDDAWTAFPEEREELIRFWDGLGRPVLVLTGDLHNSFAVKVTDRVWEFASGPHNSRNHPASSEGGRPASGPFQSLGRVCDVRWSTWFLDESPRDERKQPVYCVVQLNNVLENPAEGGGRVRVAYPRPQAVFRYHDGFTGELLYAEAVAATR